MDDRFEATNTNTGTLLAQQHVAVDHLKASVDGLRMDVSNAVAQAATANTNAAHV